MARLLHPATLAVNTQGGLSFNRWLPHTPVENGARRDGEGGRRLVNNNGAQKRFDWETKTGKGASGLEDMVLVNKISDDAIVDNLKKRFMDDLIYVRFASRARPVLTDVCRRTSAPS